MTKFIRRRFASEHMQQKKDTIWHRLVNRSMALPILLLLVIVFASFSYLFYINQTATGSFDIKGLQTKIETLQDANKKLELQTADMQSLAAIEASVQELQMVSVSTIEYLPAVGSAVAVR